MSYEVFKSKVNALIKRADEGIKVEFCNDTESGKFFAYCSDDTTIIGCSKCLRVTVRWNGKNHQSMAEI